MRYILSCRDCPHIWLWPPNRIEIKQKCPHCQSQWWGATRA